MKTIKGKVVKPVQSLVQDLSFKMCYVCKDTHPHDSEGRCSLCGSQEVRVSEIQSDDFTEELLHHLINGIFKNIH